MTFINVRCQYCEKLLCEVTTDFIGLLRIRCRHNKCHQMNTVSLATIVKQAESKSGIIKFPTRASAQ